MHLKNRYSSMKYTRDAFGSRLEISIFSDTKNDSGISESFLMVEEFEKKYSRFITNNLLSEINSGKKIKIQKEIISLIQLCLKVSKLTQGYFDITILPLLENAGYGVKKDIMKESLGYENITLNDDFLTLQQNTQIEFGSCGKWYMLDVIYAILKQYHDNFIINFWWDIRVNWTYTILLEDPWDIQKSIGNICLHNASIASSSWNRRKIWKWHHLINIKNKTCQDDKIAVYVTHRLWVFADIFATALFVSPLELSLKVLESVEWLEALIIWADGKIFKSQWFNATLTL